MEHVSKRIGILVGFAQAIPAEQENLGVFDEPVGYGSGDGRIKEDVAPAGERSVGRNHRRAFVAVARGDHLIKEVGGLLVESQVSQLVTKCSAEHLSTDESFVARRRNLRGGQVDLFIPSGGFRWRHD